MKPSLLLRLILLPFLLGTHCPAEKRVSTETWLGFPAYRLSDGKTCAVIVPELAGRVMAFGPVGGENLIYNEDPSAERRAKGGFINWGGDKTLVGPHNTWAAFANSRWPPQPSWMGEPHTAEVVADGAELQTVGPVWAGFNIRSSRRYSFTEAGELKIVQTFEKVAGEPREVTIWSVTQAREPDIVYSLAKPDSRYRNGLLLSNLTQHSLTVEEKEGLHLTTFRPGAALKVSFDAALPKLLARYGEVYWLQRGEPDATPPLKAVTLQWFPVEIYTQGKAENNYVELELMSPPVLMKEGGRRSYTVYWSLHRGLEPTDIPSVLGSVD